MDCEQHISNDVYTPRLNQNTYLCLTITPSITQYKIVFQAMVA